MSEKKPKGTAYPLRLEEDFEAEVNDVAAETGISKAEILRMSAEVGFPLVDWQKMVVPKSPVLRGVALNAPNSTSPAAAVVVASGEHAAHKPAPGASRSGRYPGPQRPKRKPSA